MLKRVRLTCSTLSRAQHYRATVLISNYPLYVSGRNWPAEIIALHLIAAALPQKCNLFVRFHSLGNYSQVELLAQRYDGCCYGSVVFVRGKIANEGFVYFETRDWKALQRSETGVPGAKIVD